MPTFRVGVGVRFRVNLRVGVRVRVRGCGTSRVSTARLLVPHFGIPRTKIFGASGLVSRARSRDAFVRSVGWDGLV